MPFRGGDEVLVHIVEPHMYDVDDAVAKIDGYIISVAGAGPLRRARSGSCASRRPAARRRPRVLVDAEPGAAGAAGSGGRRR